MQLATLRTARRDGQLLIVARRGDVCAPAPEPYSTLQAALDDWARSEPQLRAMWRKLDRGETKGDPVPHERLAAPLPRAYEWVDGSAYLNHVLLVRRARGAEPPPTLETDPLIYQGGSSDLLGPRDPITLADEDWGCDFEAEVAVILDDVPQGTLAADAGKYVRLVLIANDVSLRNLIPAELAKSFGFFQSKPATAFAPFAVTPDALGPAWEGGRLFAKMRSTYNGVVVGDCDTGPEMHFSFSELIAHITKTRRFAAGTILGSGTVSNRDRQAGVSCLAERRMLEIIEEGAPKTPFMRFGDSIEIEARIADDWSPFGRIIQRVERGRR
ncbi:MAG: fumarylacetoacetate hydrolase family protein [Deltaproteobacteria bacterium]|nr:fumarylacetoacetate hydrolase family protein [Deltaproteobacteria bacterium]